MSHYSENDFFTVQEVSSLLKLSVLTIYKYIKERKLTVIQIGGHYRIPKASLATFINSHRILRLSEGIKNEK